MPPRLTSGDSTCVQREPSEKILVLSVPLRLVFQYELTWLSKRGHYLCLNAAWCEQSLSGGIWCTYRHKETDPNPQTAHISIFCRASVVDLHVTWVHNTSRPTVSSSKASSSAFLAPLVSLHKGYCQPGSGCHVTVRFLSKSRWTQPALSYSHRHAVSPHLNLSVCVVLFLYRFFHPFLFSLYFKGHSFLAGFNSAH